jgi:hypothetical protein
MSTDLFERKYDILPKKTIRSDGQVPISSTSRRKLSGDSATSLP